jgi:HSP20 family protein
MANIARFDPFRELEKMLDRYAYSDTAGGLSKEHEGIISSRWSPSVDIKETDDAYMVKGELPGVDKSDMDVSINDNTLTIRGEKKVEKEDEKHDMHRNECFYGSFERSFSLPKQVDVNNVQASYKDGVLKLTIPKTEEEKPKQIKVDIS